MTKGKLQKKSFQTVSFFHNAARNVEKPAVLPFNRKKRGAWWHTVRVEERKGKRQLCLKRTATGGTIRTSPGYWPKARPTKSDWRISAGKHSSRRKELGEQFARQPYAVAKAVKDAYCNKDMLLPALALAPRVMPRSNWNFLIKELLSHWWLNRR
ncbi:hypothetical protein LAD77_27445 [Klebsiella pneumoniae]|nr:hypothetical protein [Klebsiella pneumoniae]